MIKRTVASAAVAALLAGVAAIGLSLPPASADGGPSSPLIVRQVDGRLAPKVVVDVATGGRPLNPQDFSVLFNGARIKGVAAETLANAQAPTATALLIDTSSSMSGAKTFALDQALNSLIATKQPNDQMAVIAYGGTPRVVQAFTTDPTVLTAAVGRLTIGGTPALYAGVDMAANLLASTPNVIPQLVIAGGADNAGTTVTAEQARADLLGSAAYTFSVGLSFPPAVDLSDLSSFASATGQGEFLSAPTASAVSSAFAAVRQSLDDQYQVTFTEQGTSAPGAFTVSTPGGSGSAEVFPGSLALGQATNPPTVSLRQGPGPLKGKTGLLLIALLILATVGLAVYALVHLVADRDLNLTTVLQTYEEREHSAEGTGDGALAQTALVQRAVETTARFAEERGILQNVETRLEQADLALRPAEALFFYGVGVILLGVVTLVLAGPLIALVVLIVAGLAPPAVLSFLANQRLRKFNSQLPDTLQLLASSLRAGFAFLQGVEAVAQEMSDPMGAELRRVIAECRLGRPVEEALADCAGRMKSADFDWAVMAVNIQREVGGNLADLLQTVSVTMVERERLRRDVKSLTAEGRMSAIVLGVLPPAMGLVFYVVNPTYIEVLFHHVGGEIALVVAVIAMIVGFVWMNKIVDVQV
jgi:tight adherence protein B